MWKYIIKRLFAMIPTMLLAILIVFVIMSFAPGDAAEIAASDGATAEQMETLRKEMGLDDPLLVRFANYILGLIKGDMGKSYKSGTAVTMEIASRFPNTAKLALLGILFSVIISLPLGIIAAIKQNSIFDTSSMVFALVGISMPQFWLGLLLVLLFSAKFRILPSSGMEGFSSYIMPAITQAVSGIAGVARITRSSMLEVIRQDYIRTARAKGFSYNVVIRKHALKNSMLPTITVVGLQICTLLAGAVITESVFAWPGIGRYLVQSISFRDTPAVLGCIVTFTLCFAMVNLIVDLLYGFVDPRLKAQYKE